MVFGVWLNVVWARASSSLKKIKIIKNNNNARSILAHCVSESESEGRWGGVVKEGI